MSMAALFDHLRDHLPVLPILLPLVAGALMLVFDERRRMLKIVLSLITLAALLWVAGALLASALAPEPGQREAIHVYRLGNWPAPFGIVLVVDRLSALMLALAAVLGTASFIFSLARWHKAGPRYYTLFLFLLMGLNGAFLTGDLFNLFVFFEVMLAASYGLVLHGSGTARIKAGLHYIPINLVASSFFLVGVSLIYGVTGTLNMADLAERIPQVSAADRTLLEAGAGILGIAFLVKAAMWPLNFWLPTTYAAASAPVAAMFAIMTKVGVYVLLRLSLLLFGGMAGASAGFGTDVLFYGGLATVAVGLTGVLASQSMPRLAGYSVLVSSGTLLAAVGTQNPSLISGALFYLVSSTLSVAAFFLLIEVIERGRIAGADVLAVSMEFFGDMEEEADPVKEEVGVALPLTIAVLGCGFIACTALLAGLPPLSGFIGKFALLSALMDGAGVRSAATWVFVGLLSLSGFATLIAMTRTGINTFWVPMEAMLPKVRRVEFAAITVLLGLCAGLTVFAGPAMAYMDATARMLNRPSAYIEEVLAVARAGLPAPGANREGGH